MSLSDNIAPDRVTIGHLMSIEQGADIGTAEYLVTPAYTTAEVREKLRLFFESRDEEVFFARQVHVLFEDEYFHWLTHWGLRELEALGIIRSEERVLREGSTIKLFWHRSFRYYRRAAKRLVRLVEEYADPNIGAAIGLQGEAMVLEGFAGLRFVLEGRDVKEYGGRVWVESEHNLDFVFSRDGLSYGVEVKNTLSYIEKEEFDIKIRLCEALGVVPVFVVRMLPKTWTFELIQRGGFALILKYQLYPWAHKDLARRVARELGLPVDAPRRLSDSTMARFLKWHLARIG